MNQTWFEMDDIKRHKYTSAVWIPLRVTKRRSKGKHGHLGFCEEFFGLNSLAINTNKKEEGLKLDWGSAGLSDESHSFVRDDGYISSDVFESFSGEQLGLRLVMAQHYSGDEIPFWHLHQDLVISLGLMREEDRWVCPNEGYIEVARLFRDREQKPELLEIRSEFLRDYLCARSMGLFITEYHSRREVVKEATHITWPQERMSENNENERWFGSVVAIHEGGSSYGSSTFVSWAGRNDVDEKEDVPTFENPTDKEIDSKSWEVKDEGEKLFLVSGEFWKKTWVDEGLVSPRVRKDKLSETVFFITDANGRKESKETLVDEVSRWLWFRPDVISALANRRGGTLGWYTGNTGWVSCSPDYKIHFGINSIGLINAYAKDIGYLPDWQQNIWAGFNCGPEGGVSAELLSSQMEAKPADTEAPEVGFSKMLRLLNIVFKTAIGSPLFKDHKDQNDILATINRFRVTDRTSLLSLAKDIARLTADRIDIGVLHRLAPPPKGQNWGSLKSLEKVLTLCVSEEKAKKLMTPLFGIWELRLLDAHLPKAEDLESFKKININPEPPWVLQGAELIFSSILALRGIAEVFNAWNPTKVSGGHQK